MNYVYTSRKLVYNSWSRCWRYQEEAVHQSIHPLIKKVNGLEWKFTKIPVVTLSSTAKALDHNTMMADQIQQNKRWEMLHRASQLKYTGGRIPSTCVGRSPAALPDLGRAQRAGGARAKGRLCNDSISRGHQTLRITPRQHLSLPVVTIAMWHDGVVVVHLSLPQLPLVSDAWRPPQGRDGPSVHPTEKTPH